MLHSFFFFFFFLPNVQNLRRYFQVEVQEKINRYKEEGGKIVACMKGMCCGQDGVSLSIMCVFALIVFMWIYIDSREQTLESIS